MMGMFVWSFRLTYNWAKNWKDLREVDWRYRMLHDKSPKLWVLTNLFGIQLFPTLIVYIQLIGGIRLIQLNPSLNLWMILGTALMFIATLIQVVADQQMFEFREKNQGQKRCMEEGLWKYSRHPNYFGEVLVWWSLFLMYFGAVQTIDFQLIAPLAMTALFLFISIPMMEKKILLTRPEYKNYQKRVSMLVPFFRRDNNDKAYETKAS
ncbi:MAG: DUF1295 domain-containing protein, partial [Acholeplasmataceae bacterium]|nr:DUF1295 domain-containing protein [Acholeplasmataceae bacterium]